MEPPLIEQLALRKLRVGSPAPHQPGVVAHTYTPSIWEVGAEESEGKDILGYKGSLRTAWAP